MKKLLFNPIFTVLITFFAFLIILSLNKTSNKASIAQNNLSQIEQDISYLEQEVENNKNLLYQTQNDFNKEKIIRNELLMKKEGEIIVNLPLKGLAKNSDSEAKKLTAWQSWMELLRWRKEVERVNF